MPLDAESIAAAAAEAVGPLLRKQREHIGALEARLVAIEDRASVPGPAGERGEKGEPGEVGPAGRDADTQEIAARLLPEMERAVSELQKPEPGPKGAKGEPGERGERGDPGKDADPATVVPLVLEALPAPEKGEKGDPGGRGEPGEKGADGVGVKDVLIDRKGSLVLTMEDGRIRELGVVVGKDGEPGVPGKDGRDGLGFDDLSVTHDGHRTFTLSFARGSERKAFDFSLPVTLDRGVFREGETYKAGDGVTYGGSWWIAQAETTIKPGEGAEDWRLAVKRGRDGKVPDIDALVERALPKLTQKLAPVIRRAIDDAMKNG